MANPPEAGRSAPPVAPAAGLLSAAAILLSGLCLAYLVWAADRGFDIADDAYYVVEAANAYSYRFSLTEFGQIWHPVYLFVGGALGLYRLAGTLLLAACASIFAWFLLGRHTVLQIGKSAYLAAFLALAASVFWFYGNWFPTPNYNTVNLAGLLLFFSGLLAADDEARVSARLRFWLPSLLSAIGLCGMALVKPTSACLAVMIGCIWLAISRPRLAWMRLAVAAVMAMSLLFTIILAIDGSGANFLSRKLFSIEALALRQRGYDVGSLVAAAVSPFAVGRLWKVFDALSLGLILFVLTGGWIFAALSSVRAKARLGAGAVFAAVFSGLVAYWRALDIAAVPVIPAYHVWHFSAVIIGGGCWILAMVVERGLPSPQRMAIAALLMAAPLVYAFGTADTLVLALSGAGIFWIAGGIYALKGLPPASRQRVFPAVSFFAAASILGVLLGMGFSPWRGAASIWDQRNRLDIAGNHVRVDDATRLYLRTFQQTAAANGFLRGGGLMDLSGSGPGLGLAIGGRPVGAPWLSPSGPGAMRFNRHILGTVPAAELRRAWIITRGAGDRAAETGLLKSIGLNFPEGYERLVSRSRPDMGWDHVLWKPRPNP